ncbi:hypothetical protein Tsubulata_029369 [Turnera subulata]|uniref:Uncharacterized protein n=1 Tax=Turnera subulata TaxID=218843 RepID=A0A9Q0J0V9_9ROSI|nr:hypothetical protein Tsubulata_029369 [Turnera subulata]
MESTQKYQEYRQGQKNQLPGFDLKRLENILEKCERITESQGEQSDGTLVDQSCHCNCPECYEMFPSALKEMSTAVDCFNKLAEELRKLHLASGFGKYVMWVRGELRWNSRELVQELKDLVKDALTKAVAVQNAIRKCDQV